MPRFDELRYRAFRGRLMPQRCTICSRPDAGSINALLGEGRSARSVAVELGLSEDALQRHAARHLARKPAAPRLRTETARSSDTAEPLDELVDALRDQALAGNPAIVHQYRLALAAQADMRHAAAPRRLADEPEWVRLRTRLLDCLEHYPAARKAISAAIEAGA